MLLFCHSADPIIQASVNTCSVPCWQVCALLSLSPWLSDGRLPAVSSHDASSVCAHVSVSYSPLLIRTPVVLA